MNTDNITPITAVTSLPNDTRAEAAALASVLVQGGEHLRAVRRIGLVTEAFYTQVHRNIFEACIALADHDEPIDPTTVRAYLKAEHKADKRTDLLLADLLSQESGANTTMFAEAVVAAWRKREMIAALNDGLARVQADEPFDPASLTTVGAAKAVFRPEPLDLNAERGDEQAYLVEPYLPRAARVWAVGAAESVKSMYALWLACGLSRDGYRVVYISQENGEAEDRRRIDRLAPNPAMFSLYNGEGFDLANPEHRAVLRGITDGADLLVLDTLTACWSGDENDNAAIAAFDRDALAPVVKSGCAVLTIHHTGHPGAFGARKGVGAARGASSIGQKADVLLHFEAEGEPGAFRISHDKNRFGGYKAPVSYFRVADRDDGGLTIATEARTLSSFSEADADLAVTLIAAAGRVVGKKALHRALTYDGGLSHQRASAAIARLDAEQPRRVIHRRESVETVGGVQQAEVYTLTEPTLGLGN